MPGRQLARPQQLTPSTCAASGKVELELAAGTAAGPILLHSQQGAAFFLPDTVLCSCPSQQEKGSRESRGGIWSLDRLGCCRTCLTPPPDTVPALPACWPRALPLPQLPSLFPGSHQCHTRPRCSQGPSSTPLFPPASHSPCQPPTGPPVPRARRRPTYLTRTPWLCPAHPASALPAPRAPRELEQQDGLCLPQKSYPTYFSSPPCSAPTPGKQTRMESRGPTPLPPAQHTSCGRGQELCLGGRGSFPSNWELMPTGRRAVTKRQAAGGTLCLLFEQAFPVVYCAEERSKVEGPIARAVIYCIWKGSKGIF
ncbi:uncharacterized protein LOC132335488 [Haemorhous mexicanus]|uniref:uncharacterized protein LOC132335488 n=1 Tax=Haemorhous mexicanus TaxID=30427 RepID=UPI0028BE0C74|nr:uncharacterized protein LOC132335488 [Haemorhous mexicanus]